jgi:hypothetical protein
MVVFVGVGFLYMSISVLDVFLIIRRSRKFMCPLSSYVGFSCRFGCNWLTCLWMVLSFMCLVS